MEDEAENARLRQGVAPDAPLHRVEFLPHQVGRGRRTRRPIGLSLAPSTAPTSGMSLPFPNAIQNKP